MLATLKIATIFTLHSFQKQRFNRKLKYDLCISKGKQITDNSITSKKHRLTSFLPLNNKTPFTTSAENWNIHFDSVKFNYK